MVVSITFPLRSTGLDFQLPWGLLHNTCIDTLVVNLSIQHSLSCALYFIEATEVQLELFNNMHVQQALALVSQHPELTEVLKIQLEVTEGDEPAGAPPELNPIVQAAIKTVDRREGSIPAFIPSEREYSSYVSLTLGLKNQQSYSRLSRYLQSVTQLDLIPVEDNGNCMFSSVRRAVDCPLEYQTIHLKRQLVMMMANHQEYLFPILKASIATTYGFPRMSQEKYQRRYDESTLTQGDADDHLTPGPFSYLGYMKALLEDGFWGDELCLALISMMWQISITILRAKDSHQIKFRHSKKLKDTDLVLVHCQGCHYIPASKF